MVNCKLKENKNNRICKSIPKKLKPAQINVLIPSEFDRKFKRQYRKGLQGIGTTKIYPSGTIKVFIRDSGDESINDKTIEHELNEVKIWFDMVKKGKDPREAQRIAHNLNPIKDVGDVEYKI